MRKRYTIGQGQFDESKHARDEDGRFTSRGGGSPPSFRQRQLVERSPGPAFEEKWGRRGGAFQQAQGAPPGRGHNARSSWERLGNKNPNLPEDYTGSKERELPVDGYLRHAMTWQRPKALKPKEHDAIRSALVGQIVEIRQPTIDRATEKGLIPEGVSRRSVQRAYNLASLRALHEYGVGSLDYAMTDQLKQEMMPLVPAMRYMQRRIGNTMRSDARTKGLWAPYKEEFGVPYADRRLDRRKGKQNQLRLKWPTSHGAHVEFIKAEPMGALAKGGGHDESKHPRDEKGRWKAAAGAAVATGVAVRATRAGAERVLGAQRFVHGSSRGAVGSIMRSGLDPRMGGGAHGGTHGMFGARTAATHAGEVYVAADTFGGRRFAAAPHAALSQAVEDARTSGKPLANPSLHYFGGVLLPPLPWRNRVGGAMRYEDFHATFRRDTRMPGVIQAFVGNKRVGPESLRRSRAGLMQIFNARSSNIPLYVKKNPGRAGAGVALLVLGGTAADQARRYAQEALKAHLPGELQKGAAHPGAETSLAIADEIIAARREALRPRRGPPPGAAPAAVQAILPLARRVMREGEARMDALAVEPSKRRHKVSERVIRDPSRPLAHVLG